MICTYIMIQWKMGPSKRCVACLQNSKRSTSIDLKKYPWITWPGTIYQRNHDRTNRKQDEDFPKKTQTASSDSKLQLCVSLQFLEKPHAFCGVNTYIASQKKMWRETHPANHAHPRHMLLFWCTSSHMQPMEMRGRLAAEKAVWLDMFGSATSITRSLLLVDFKTYLKKQNKEPQKQHQK